MLRISLLDDGVIILGETSILLRDPPIRRKRNRRRMANCETC